jgi:hypothetical protein
MTVFVCYKDSFCLLLVKLITLGVGVVEFMLFIEQICFAY